MECLHYQVYLLGESFQACKVAAEEQPSFSDTLLRLILNKSYT